METGRKTILSFADLEIGFEAAGRRAAILPQLEGMALEGELIAVIGPNGVGKSTLLRTLSGLQDSIGGELIIDGRNIQQYTRAGLSAKVGFISTEIVRVSNLHVYDLIAMGRFPHTNWYGTISRTDHEIIRDAAAKTGLNDFLKRSVNQLSDGERQRAMIAMVLAQDPGLMVMDEPTAFLDITNRFEIMHLMHELTRARKKTIIFSTHDLGIALSQADKIWLLGSEGMFFGSPEDLMLKDAFNRLFDMEKVSYNIEDGTFRIKNDNGLMVKIKGSGKEKLWTEKALQRAGYTISSSDSYLPLVEVSVSPELKWTFTSGSVSRQFSSIYDLIGWISYNNLND